MVQLESGFISLIKVIHCDLAHSKTKKLLQQPATSQSVSITPSTYLYQIYHVEINVYIIFVVIEGIMCVLFSQYA